MPANSENGHDAQQGTDEVTTGGGVGIRDATTTRRALLTGGAVVAGAAVVTVATSEKASAAAYVVLGGANTTTTNTYITNTSGTLALGSVANRQNGIGMLGTANAGTAARGVQGSTREGTGVLGSSSTGIGVKGTSTSAEGVFGISNNSVGVRGTSTGNTGVSGTSANSDGVSGYSGYAGVRGDAGSYGGIFYGNNSGSYGVYSSGQAYGVRASGGSYGVYATSNSYGVYATSGYWGVYGSGSTGVRGSGSNTGVYGEGSEVGVWGSGGKWGLYASGTSYGVHGTAPSDGTALAVYGFGGKYSVRGSGASTAAFRGETGYVGVWGDGGSFGAQFTATNTSGANYGVLAITNSPDGYAGWFSGAVKVVGTVSKSAGSFQIDHPLDPEHKWLSHSFVESPDMMNVYNGNVTTDPSGLATVRLPAYFKALNRDFRYQLTVIGKMAHAIIDREISNNQFRTDQGNVKVSWQVTGIRQDDYAKAHPIVVEQVKKGSEAGTRQFVPKGSSARLMRVGATRGPSAGPASLPEMEVPPLPPASSSSPSRP